jgi:hypothetical protein
MIINTKWYFTLNYSSSEVRKLKAKLWMPASGQFHVFLLGNEHSSNCQELGRFYKSDWTWK